jgi:hypothetical protein
MGRLHWEGLPRKMFREHLEYCAACRQDLEALGFTPSLPHDPELDAGEENPGKPTDAAPAGPE